MPTCQNLSTIFGAEILTTRRERAVLLAIGQPLREVLDDFVLRHPILHHRVALPDSDGLIIEGVEVDRDTVRRTDFILSTVATANCLGVIEVDVPGLPQPR